ncbi:methyltransferase family protein [Dictyobacter aurantiacus]|uniref:Isoprenylcysteine carboxyl methyltransferase n=1 Tax=Dictyobacter aurantiacus TaxID=1936993 RepID=A0A401ZKH2_9CHLR|nr:isoprenylcysteine carboxylmethyltransferase family protein [Dictyobacter aurantiacus]GCE07328.1 isoprenylcysteine carboxyl methyltransferase [Dictyobacter aurantiacus]
MVNLKLLSAQLVFLVLLFSVPLFLAAGTLAWPAGWTFLVLFFAFTFALTAWLYRHNPDLLRERMATKNPGQKSWDRIGMSGMFVLFLAWLVLMPLDAVRFHWSHMSLWLQIVGALLMLWSFWLFFATFRENSFLSPMVRIQSERGQTVISTGPYHYVRHPMYAAALCMLLGSALLLGSWFGLLAALLLIVAIAIRAIFEERTLQQELQGYADYKTHVRYRLIPYIW